MSSRVLDVSVFCFECIPCSSIELICRPLPAFFNFLTAEEDAYEAGSLLENAFENALK